jgi:hypothetical protein
MASWEWIGERETARREVQTSLHQVQWGYNTQECVISHRLKWYRRKQIRNLTEEEWHSAAWYVVSKFVFSPVSYVCARMIENATRLNGWIFKVISCFVNFFIVWIKEMRSFTITILHWLLKLLTPKGTIGFYIYLHSKTVIVFCQCFFLLKFGKWFCTSVQ